MFVLFASELHFLKEQKLFFDQAIEYELATENQIKQIFIIDEPDTDDTKYTFRFVRGEDDTIEGLTKGLLRHGIKLVKEQRMHEVYRIEFF